MEGGLRHHAVFFTGWRVLVPVQLTSNSRPRVLSGATLCEVLAQPGDWRRRRVDKGGSNLGKEGPKDEEERDSHAA